MRAPTISLMTTYACKYVIVILANVMMNIAGSVPQFFLFTPYYTLDNDMWNDIGNRIAHLSLLILVFAQRYLLNVLCRLV
jgi:hypothetical protein